VAVGDIGTSDLDLLLEHLLKPLNSNLGSWIRLGVFVVMGLSILRVFLGGDGSPWLSIKDLTLIGNQFRQPMALATEPEDARNSYLPDLIIGKAQVVDGDTFDLIYEAPLAGRYRQTSRIRLDAVDACESTQSAMYDEIRWPCGAVATAWLVAKTMGKEVSCQPSRIDSYGRYLARCTVDGADIGLAGLSEGLMIIYRHRDQLIAPAYEQAETLARSSKRGMWLSEFADPYNYRKLNGSYNPFDSKR